MRRHQQEETESLENDLAQRVNLLKKVTIDIGHEVRQQNSLLNEMDEGFEKSNSLLSSSIKRVSKLMKNGNCWNYIYLLLFSFFVFFVIWVIIKTR